MWPESREFSALDQHQTHRLDAKLARVLRAAQPRSLEVCIVDLLAPARGGGDRLVARRVRLVAAAHRAEGDVVAARVLERITIALGLVIGNDFEGLASRRVRRPKEAVASAEALEHASFISRLGINGTWGMRGQLAGCSAVHVPNSRTPLSKGVKATEPILNIFAFSTRLSGATHVALVPSASNSMSPVSTSTIMILRFSR